MAEPEKQGSTAASATDGAAEAKTAAPASETGAGGAAAATPPAASAAPTSAPGKDAKPAVKKDKAKAGAETVYTGELLKQVRESQRITLKEIAERTRISVANLAALENEKYEDLPNARVYVRGFVRCLAVEIGLDRDQVSRTYLPRWEAWSAAQSERGR